MLWPHTPYAEDQSFSRLILISHVLHRGFQTGAAIGVLGGTASSILALRSSVSLSSAQAASRFVMSTGRGAVWGLGLMAILLPFRVSGLQKIEWQDRSWRLLENEGQVEVDNWSVGGATLGIAATALARRRGMISIVQTGTPISLKAQLHSVIGGAGIGSLTGVLGYMVWRYVIRQGRR